MDLYIPWQPDKSEQTMQTQIRQKLQKASTDKGLHCLPLIQVIRRVVKWIFKFKDMYGKKFSSPIIWGKYIYILFS